MEGRASAPPHSSLTQGQDSTRDRLVPTALLFVPPLPGSSLPGAFGVLHPSNQPLDDRPQRAVPGSQLWLLIRLQQELMAGDRPDLGVGRGKARVSEESLERPPVTPSTPSPKSLGPRETALTCRTLRRLDRWRPLARAAPRRSTLLSGRLPAGAWR